MLSKLMYLSTFAVLLTLVGNWILTFHGAQSLEFAKELTADNFQSTLEQHTNTIVMFYAPWCGHCQETKPKFRQAAEELANIDKAKLFALVNCEDNKNSNFCTKEKIEGYPTFKVYQKSTLIGEYDDDPVQKQFVEYMKNPPKPGETRPSKHSDTTVDTPMKNVIYMDGDKVEDFLKNNNHVLIFFYAPWCPHCQEAKPKFEEAATTMVDKEKISNKIFMAVNCDDTKNKNFCNTEKVDGFPTIRYYHKGEMFAEYEEEFEAKSFVSFMKNPPKEKVPPTPIEEETNELNGTKSTEEKKEHIHESTTGHEMKGVQYLTPKTFHALVEDTQHPVMIFFQSANCPAEATFHFEQAAADSKYNKEFKFAAVDCEVSANKDLCTDQKIGHHPVINHYYNGIKVEVYPGPTPTTESLISYISKKSTLIKTEL